MEYPWQKFYHPQTNPNAGRDAKGNILYLLEEAFRRFQDRPAMSCLGATINYSQLSDMVNRCASFFQHQLGLQKGDRLAIMLPNVMQFPIAVLAAQKIGVICVNTNPLYTPREMRHQFADSGATAILIIDLFVNKLEEIIKDTAIRKVMVTSIGDQLPLWKGVPLDLLLRIKGVVPKHGLKIIKFKDALREGDPRKVMAVETSDDDLSMLQYTGGTTGVAKGAMLTHRSILANMLQIREVAKPFVDEGQEVVLTALPIYHIFAFTANFVTFLSLGEHIVLVPKPIPIENTVKIFKKYPISVMTGVNTLFNALNNSKEFQALAPRTIKLAVAGGMALQDHVNKAFQKITGTKIIEGFGLTEASPVTHLNPAGRENPLGSIGIPLPGTEARVVDEQGRDVPMGEPGEMIVRGPQVMKGYWNRPDETVKVIKDGWLWTGDMAKINEDGFFFIVDRKKDMILVSGFNVYPNEIEEVLASHPKVLEAAVIGIPNKNTGETVKAFVVAKDKSLTVEELQKHCKERLTGYKCPRSYEFRDQLPKTNVGKILRRELRTNVTENAS